MCKSEITKAKDFTFSVALLRAFFLDLGLKALNLALNRFGLKRKKKLLGFEKTREIGI